MRIRNVVSTIALWIATVWVVVRLAVEVIGALFGVAPRERWRDYDED